MTARARGEGEKAELGVVVKTGARGGERAKRASFEEDEHTRDESREMASQHHYIMATSTTELTLFHSIILTRFTRFALASLKMHLASLGAVVDIRDLCQAATKASSKDGSNANADNVATSSENLSRSLKRENTAQTEGVFTFQQEAILLGSSSSSSSSSSCSGVVKNLGGEKEIVNEKLVMAGGTAIALVGAAPKIGIGVTTTNSSADAILPLVRASVLNKLKENYNRSSLLEAAKTLEKYEKGVRAGVKERERMEVCCANFLEQVEQNDGSSSGSGDFDFEAVNRLYEEWRAVEIL